MRRSFRRRGLLNGLREVRALLAVHPLMRFARKIIRNSLTINMKSYTTGRSRRGRGRSRRRHGGDGQGRRSDVKAAPQKKGFWSKIAGFFAAPEKVKAEQRNGSSSRQQARPARKPESVEVTSPRLYVGNLSFDATESDLFDLFNGVGHVQNAEVVSYKHNQRSKGFAFVQMQSVEEAKRAVTELHDKEFLGRKLVVSGAKSNEHSRG
jgi:RNA recognition motif. (a.k.a. RRM, RBD, or RNP domain)